MGSPDWTLVFDVCERVSASENNAKAVAKALRKELKYTLFYFNNDLAF